MSKRKPKPVGRPSKFDPTKIEQAYKLALLGATDKQMADFWGVTEQTLNNWKTAHPDFFESLKAGKLVADATVAESLLHRAKGYSHDAVKIFNDRETGVTQVPYIERYPPDTTAAIFWLKNRQPAIWRDKTETNHKLVDDTDTPIALPELARRLAFLLTTAASEAQAAPAAPPLKH